MHHHSLIIQGTMGPIRNSSQQLVFSSSACISVKQQEAANPSPAAGALGGGLLTLQYNNNNNNGKQDPVTNPAPRDQTPSLVSYPVKLAHSPQHMDTEPVTKPCSATATKPSTHRLPFQARIGCEDSVLKQLPSRHVRHGQ